VLVFLVFLLCLLISSVKACSAAAGESHTDVPRSVDPSQKYLFYMHGKWIEMHGLNRAHPQHGRYQYREIVDALAQRGFVVISEARTGGGRMGEYARKVAEQISELIAQGVPPSNITVIGHSKGGYMALMVSSMLRKPDLTFVVMAGCGKEGTQFRRSYERFLEKGAAGLSGRILSIYDTADTAAGSCAEAFDLSGQTRSREKVFHTGRGHGLFYSPDPVWIGEIVEFTAG